jgi:hypothetical protein
MFIFHAGRCYRRLKGFAESRRGKGEEDSVTVGAFSSGRKRITGQGPSITDKRQAGGDWRSNTL